MLRTAILTAILATAPVVAAAQDNPLEFSVDGGLDYTLHEFSDNATRVLLPSRGFRFGVGMTARTAIEAFLAMTTGSAGDDSSTDLVFAPTLTYHFRDLSSDRARPYVNVSGAMSYLDASSGDLSAGDTQFGVGAGLGTKKPLRGGPVFLRLEGGLLYWAESDLRWSATQLRAVVGIGATF